jgi:hypothetical protein
MNSLKLTFFMGLHSKNIRVIGKTMLFKFKILVKVILIVQVSKSTNEEEERI